MQVVEIAKEFMFGMGFARSFIIKASHYMLIKGCLALFKHFKGSTPMLSTIGKHLIK